MLPGRRAKTAHGRSMTRYANEVEVRANGSRTSGSPAVGPANPDQESPLALVHLGRRTPGPHAVSTE